MKRLILYCSLFFFTIWACTACSPAAAPTPEATIAPLPTPTIAIDPETMQDGLYTAVQEDNNEAIAQYIAAGADVNDGGSLGVPMLHIAVKRGNNEGITLLLEAGATTNGDIINDAILSADLTPEIVQAIIDFSADVNAIDSTVVGRTPLMRAAEIGNLELGRYLIENGADIHLVDNFNDPAVNYAAFYGQLEFVQMLVDKGADINLVGFNNATALAHARGEGHQEVVAYLESIGGIE